MGPQRSRRGPKQDPGFHVNIQTKSLGQEREKKGSEIDELPLIF